MKKDHAVNDACTRVDRLIEELLTGNGDASMFHEVEDHICSCGRCRAAWGDMLVLVRVSEMTPVQLPPGRTWEELSERTRWRLAAAAREEEQSHQLPMLPFAAAILAGIVALAVIPAGLLAAVDLLSSLEIFATVEFWKYYGIAVGVEVVGFHALAGMMIPLMKFPLRSRRKRTAEQIRIQVFSI